MTTNETAPLPAKAMGPKCKLPTTAKHTTKRKALPVDNPALWAKVAPGARWRDCVTHGKVELPDVAERTLGSRGVHIAATCPECGCFLGMLACKGGAA